MNRPWSTEQENRWRDPEHLRRVAEHLARRQSKVVDLLAEFLCGLEQNELASLQEAAALQKIKFAIDVLGGKPAGPNQFADCCMVGLRAGGPAWFASGVLVHKRVVVTAAHVGSSGYEPNVVSLPTDGITIPPGTVVSATRFEPEPGGADIAVMVLADDVVNVTPIARASTSEIDQATKTTVAGFGANAVGGGFLDRKRHADLDITGTTPEELVAGASGKGVCKGDSGGPAYITTSSGLRLAGITSRAAVGSGLCGDGGIFTRVDKYQTFIESFF
jgi:hypothetical protein